MRTFNEDLKLETERLILRLISEEDYLDLNKNIFSQEKVLRTFSSRQVELNDPSVVKSLANRARESKTYIFSIILKEINQPIGIVLECSLPDHLHNSIELGYAIGEAFWNKGYTTEAVKKVIEFEFESDLHKIVITHFEGNKPSKRVIEKCGLTYEGTLKDDIFYHDSYHNVCYYGIINVNKK